MELGSKILSILPFADFDDFSIGVIRFAYGYVHSKCIQVVIIDDLDLVTHHGWFVKCGLSIE